MGFTLCIADLSRNIGCKGIYVILVYDIRRDLLRESTRLEYEQARYETDPEVVSFLEPSHLALSSKSYERDLVFLCRDTAMMNSGSLFVPRYEI